MKSLFYSICLILLTSFQSQAQKSEEAVIKIKIAPKTFVKLYHADQQFEKVTETFVNSGIQEQYIEKNIVLSQPTIFKYEGEKGRDVYHHEFLVNPKDTLYFVFDKGRLLVDQRVGQMKFVDEQFNFNFGSAGNITNNVVHKKNLRLIDSLANKGLLDRNRKHQLKLFVKLKYYIWASSHALKSNADSQQLAFLFTESESKIDRFKTINTLDLLDLYRNVMAFKMRKNYGTSLSDLIRMTIANEQTALGKALISKELNDYKQKNSPEYLNAIRYLSTSSYAGINTLQKELLAKPLLNGDGKKGNLQLELDQVPENGLLVLDFWASWCVPCIREFPSLKEQKEKLSGLPIRFVPISIDVDKNNQAWLERAKQYDYLFEKKNYRILDEHRKTFETFFKLTEIPRYIVLDKNGNIIDGNLSRPSQSAFAKSLINYVKRMAL
jgi:thiol-disulfide isomerase/thioredoxin